tara:strand:+ start:60 stop:305 length:246 start_codon:yes stop_codon:yes gene_type:complete
VHHFFFDFKNKTTEHYSVLFDGNGAEPDKFSAKWGWYPSLYALAGENYLKLDEVTAQSVGGVFTHLAFLKDLHYKLKNDNV